jgi:hypothetical protein
MRLQLLDASQSLNSFAIAQPLATIAGPINHSAVADRLLTLPPAARVRSTCKSPSSSVYDYAL